MGQFFKVSLVLATLFSLASCDAPSGGRARSRTLANMSASSAPASGNNFSSSGTGTTTDTTSGSSGSSNLGAGYESCNLSSFKTVAAFSLAICQSTQDETKIKVKFANTDLTNATCFVPTYKSTDGSSIYVGQAQCSTHSANQVLDGTLVKNRPGYSQAIINGVMIMKQARLNDYFACMDAIPNFIANNCPANPSMCSSAAASFRDSVCSYFVSQGNYLDVKLK